jgi:hypothetical protein
MKLLCKYHPTRLAHFHCPDCGDHYCPDCIEVKKKGLGAIAARRCIRCGAEVEWVGVGNLIEPLTTRVPKIFLYGFAPWPLTLNILLILGNFIFSLPSLYFFLIRLALFALLVKYAFAALRATARGILTPPPAWGDSVTTDFSTVFKQFMIFVVVGAVTGYVSTQVGKGAGILFALASLAYLPAMVIMLAATDSLLAALNPIGFGPLAFRIGKDYLLMYFFLTILLGAPAALWSAFLQHLPSGVSLLLAQFAGNYYMIIAYHLMGYVILLHHQDIGYEVRYDEFRGAEKQNGQEEKSPQQQLLSQASVMIKEGAADEALELIKMKIR